MRRLLLTLPVLLLAACQTDETVSGYADPSVVYVLQELDGAAFPARATISFPEPGRVAGEGPCNRYTARQAVPYPWIQIGEIAATRRACPDLAAEAAYLAALRSVTLAEAAGDVLILSGDAGPEMVFRAQD
jgi:heat shock protein HslJ